jgi:hypothetical protein
MRNRLIQSLQNSKYTNHVYLKFHDPYHSIKIDELIKPEDFKI